MREQAELEVGGGGGESDIAFWFALWVLVGCRQGGTGLRNGVQGEVDFHKRDGHGIRRNDPT